VKSLKTNAKIGIILVIALVIGVFHVIPYLRQEPKTLVEKSSITPEPDKKLQAALDKGRPVFLEFYGVT
jgi:thiol:disulfide interchange protein